MEKFEDLSSLLLSYKPLEFWRIKYVRKTFLAKYEENIVYPGKCHFTLCDQQSQFPKLFLLEVIELFPIKNDKTAIMSVICFCQHAILAKTLTKMTTEITFFLPNDVGLHAPTVLF